MKRILLFILISVSIFSSTYRVMKVSDGDTITVLNLETAEKTKIRLYGIDSPEMNQSFGSQAKGIFDGSNFKQRSTVRNKKY